MRNHCNCRADLLSLTTLTTLLAGTTLLCKSWAHSLRLTTLTTSWPLSLTTLTTLLAQTTLLQVFDKFAEVDDFDNLADFDEFTVRVELADFDG